MSELIQTEQTASRFELVQRQAKWLASSDMVPKQYKGNVANCMIALDTADRLGVSWLAVMQNLVIIHGKPSWQSTFVIAMMNQSNRFTTLHYRYIGQPGTDDWGCKVVTTEKRTGDTVEGPPVTIAMAKADGWYHKDGSKWKTIPQLMLMYRAAAFFARVYCPELMLGIHTIEEVTDSEPQPGQAPKTLDDLIEVTPEVTP